MKIKLIAFLLLTLSVSSVAQKQKVWLDADTGNEMDDLYAIARLVKESSIDLVGLSSAHFNNADLITFEKWNAYDTKNLNPVKESQRLNEQILLALNRMDISHPLGSDRQIGRAWGQEDPRESDASKGIIAAVRVLGKDEKLDILTLGALTNIAAAVMMAPEILPKIRCYSLGAKLDPKTKVWNKSEFNIRNDLNAFDYLLNKVGFEFIIMPLETAFPLQFFRDATYSKLNDSIEIEGILKMRWEQHNPNDTKRVMWDLALIEAYLNPGLCKMEEVQTPPENTKRKIKAFIKIEEKKLADDFWAVLKK